MIFFCKQKKADELRISDWSSDVCSSDLNSALAPPPAKAGGGWEGVPTVRMIQKAPLPNPPLPSQGRGLKLTAEAAPARAGKPRRRRANSCHIRRAAASCHPEPLLPLRFRRPPCPAKPDSSSLPWCCSHSSATASRSEEHTS